MADRRRPLIRGLVVLAAAWLAVFAGMLALAGSAAAAQTPGTFTDLGTDLGTPKALSATDEVLGDTSVWRDGQLITPANVAGASSDMPAMTMRDMSPDGVVVGWAYEPGDLETHSVIWNQRTSMVPVFYSPFADAQQNSCNTAQNTGSDIAISIDSSDEAGGLEQYNSATGSAQQPCDAHAVVFTAGLGGSDQTLTDFGNVSGTATFESLQPRWAVASTFGLSYLIARPGGSFITLPDPVDGQRAEYGGSHVLAPDGSTISDGSDAFQTSTGAVTPLAVPSGAQAGQTVPLAINASHEIVGQEMDTSGNLHALLWTSPTAQPVDMSTLPGVPTGWTLTNATAINDQGDIAGTATDANGIVHAYLMSVVPPDLSASIVLTDAKGRPFTGPGAPGTTLVATVTLAAAATAKAPITGITVDPGGITVSPSNALTYVSGAPSGPVSLNPGQSTSYSITYTIASRGQANLSVNADGTENGLPESASASVIAHLVQPFAIAVSFTQNGTDLAASPLGANTIKLGDNDAGEIPQTVTAVVKLTNVSQTKQDHPVFYGTPSVSFHDAAHATPPLPFGVTAGPTYPAPATALPDLAPGASTTATYTLTVDHNGIADFSPSVLSTDDGTNDNNLSSGTSALTALPTAILWLTLKPSGALQGLIPAGTGGQITGTLTNRSLLNAVDVTPIVPELSGNVGGGVIQDTAQGPLPDGVQPAFTGILKPGAEKSIVANVATSAVAGTRGQLDYTLEGQLINNDGSQTVLTGAQLGMSAGTSPILIHISTADPPVASYSDQSIVGSFAESAMLNSIKWMAGNLQAGANLITSGNLLGAIGGGIGGAARGLAKVIVHGAQDAKETAYFVSALLAIKTGWFSLTPSDRAAFIDGIQQDFAASNLAHDFTALNLTGQYIDQKLDAGLTAFMTKIETGDYQGAASMLGTGISNVGDTALSLYLTNLATQKLALGIGKLGSGATKLVQGQLARAITLQDALRDANATSTLGKGIAAIAEGQNLLADGGAAAYKYFGVPPDMLAALRKFCQENKIIVAVRTRSQQAADLIKKGLAVGKNEAIKIKNVNEIDVNFLGYQAHDLNTVVWAEPIPRSHVLSRIAGLPKVEQETVIARYDLRVKQWNDAKIIKTIKSGEKTGFIDWDFNGTSNGAAIVRMQRRRFALYKSTPKGSSPGRFYAKVLVGEKPGKIARLVPITQDVDMMALLASNGSLLAPELRAKAYSYLSNILGIEHGETPSWLEDGEIIFQAKAKQLADTIPGGEPLLIAGPDGSMRAGFYDPALTIFDTVAKTGYIIFRGGYNNPFSLAISKLVSKVKGFN